jgi:guanine deaminase
MSHDPITPSAVRGPLLIPYENGAVDYFADGLLVGDGSGRLIYAGDAAAFGELSNLQTRPADGVMLPPLLDIHTHIPQHPIRGHFVDGVPDDPPPPEGRLLAGLNRNVFPAEARCHDADHARRVVQAFAADTLSHGVVGGATYMTSSPVATRVALEILPELWSVGLVLMDQHCPEVLHTDTDTLDGVVAELVQDFGKRLIVTDRFAIAVSTPLRRRAARLAEQHGLRTQTHLNEQVAEKHFVEQQLYPDYASYTDVYHRNGLLAHDCLVAHCIQMRPAEWDRLAAAGATVTHCPTSNLLLGSGVMPLDELHRHGLGYAIATDVGASPTVSMLAEARRFLQVHAGRSDRATAAEALVRSTVAPSARLHLADRVGRLIGGQPTSFIEVRSVSPATGRTAEHVMESLLPSDPDHPGQTVTRVTLAGRVVFEQPVTGRGPNDA